MSDVAQTAWIHAGTWKLPAGKALTLLPKVERRLVVRQGMAWVTVGRGAQPQVRSGERLYPAAGDLVLAPGQELLVTAGDVVVLEPWAMPGLAQVPTLHVDWLDAPVVVAARAPAQHVVQPQPGATPVQDIRQGLAQLGAAAGCALAGLRLAGRGLSRLAVKWAPISPGVPAVE